MVFAKLSEVFLFLGHDEATTLLVEGVDAGLAGEATVEAEALLRQLDQVLVAVAHCVMVACLQDADAPPRGASVEIVAFKHVDPPPTLHQVVGNGQPHCPAADDQIIDSGSQSWSLSIFIALTS